MLVLMKPLVVRLAVVAMGLAVPAAAQAQYNYTTNDGAATITGYTGRGGSVTIPGAMDGLPVTGIGEFAFFGCEGLAAVTIPSGVTNIGDQAFYECTNLVSVTMSSGVATIGFEAFAGCSRLTNITLPGSVASIMGGAFRRCSSLTAITVEALNPFYSSVNGVLFDKSQAVLLQYPGGKAGAAYTVPHGVIVIAAGAFSGCNNLTEITVPSTVASIGREAFAPCARLTAITVVAPNPGYRSADGVLFNGSQTMLITFPGGRTGAYTISGFVTGIGDAAFEFCTGLTSVTIPNGVTNIGEQAFYGCSRMTNVTIGDGVTSVGDGAFHSCASLTAVYFNGNAPGVGSSVFLGDSHATVYYLAGTPGWASTFGGLPAARTGSEVGSLQVIIAPAGAIAGGAQWQVDRGTLAGQWRDGHESAGGQPHGEFQHG